MVIGLLEKCALPGPVERLQKLVTSLTTDQWTSKLELQAKETLRNRFLPRTTVESRGEKQTILTSGIAVHVSSIKKQVLQLKRDTGAEEIHIVGLDSVHIDCDLEKDLWHGTNVVIVTNKLFVDVEDVCWDVSGQDALTFETEVAPSGHHPGEDGKAGMGLHTNNK